MLWWCLWYLMVCTRIMQERWPDSLPHWEVSELLGSYSGSGKTKSLKSMTCLRFSFTSHKQQKSSGKRISLWFLDRVCLTTLIYCHYQCSTSPGLCLGVSIAHAWRCTDITNADDEPFEVIVSSIHYSIKMGEQTVRWFFWPRCSYRSFCFQSKLIPHLLCIHPTDTTGQQQQLSFL